MQRVNPVIGRGIQGAGRLSDMTAPSEDTLQKLRLPQASGNSGSGQKRLNRLAMGSSIRTIRLKEGEGDSDGNGGGNSPHPVAARLAR